MQKQKIRGYLFSYEKADFPAFFLHFTASVRSRSPGPPLVPGVFHSINKNHPLYNSVIPTYMACTDNENVSLTCDLWTDNCHPSIIVIPIKIKSVSTEMENCCFWLQMIMACSLFK